MVDLICNRLSRTLPMEDVLASFSTPDCSYALPAKKGRRDGINGPGGEFMDNQTFFKDEQCSFEITGDPLRISGIFLESSHAILERGATQSGIED
jgi:hypothetical protein